MNRTVIRNAFPCDRVEIKKLQALSFRNLGKMYYSEKAIEAFISEIGTMDDYLIEDGNYMVVSEGNRIVGTGGWSTRRPSYDRNSTAQSTVTEMRATVRSVYVHPRFARQGIGRKIMAEIEEGIFQNGYSTASLTATLSGIPLYERLGYLASDPVTISLSDGLGFRGLKMEKDLLSKSHGLKNVA